MPSQRRGAVWRASVYSLAMLGSAMIAGCREERPSAGELRRSCTDPALTFDTLSQKDTVLSDGTRVRLVPETGSRDISEEGLENGRVLAKVKVVEGRGFAELGVTDSSCWFAKGRLPHHVLSTFVPFHGESLYTFKTRTHAEKHPTASVQWYPPDWKSSGTSSRSSTLPVRLVSEGGTPWPVARALAWSTCTGGYCCSPIIKPH